MRSSTTQSPAVSPEIALKMGALARERMGGLQGIAAQAPKPRVTMVGNRWDAGCTALRQFLARNQITYDWMTPDAPELATKWKESRPSDDDCPMLKVTDGPLLTRPTTRELAELLGLQTKPRFAEYDTMIIGGGPAGLAAAVYGASEGLRTVVVEREAPGGQAGTSSRIENYLGFPSGVSGDELASRALNQAKRLGAEILVTRSVVRIDPATREVTSMAATIVEARTVILGDRRHVAPPGDRRLRQADRQGHLLWRGAQRSERHPLARRPPHRRGNSAGQAALYFANHARTVTLVVRGDALEKSMSRYLIEQLAASRTCGAAALRSRRRARRHASAGDRHPRCRDRESSRCDCGGLFVFIGADAETVMAAGGYRARRARLRV
jgi:thioredoxin reductase (NADPH)